MDTAPHVAAPPVSDANLDLYRALRLPRAVEDKMLRLIRQNRISKWFSGYGQEAIAVGCAWALDDRDWLLPMHRNLGVWTTRGVPLRPLFCQMMGREGGFTNGRDRTFHFGTLEHRIVGMISHLAAMLPVADGLGLAAQLKGEDAVAVAFTGEGATREGDFHEALSLAAVWSLPVVFVVENNGYGLSTPTADAVPVDDLADAAAGYGMPGVVVDGNDLYAVIASTKKAVERARAGRGPTLLEMKTFRVRGHEEASGTAYVPDDLIAEWEARDPVAAFRARLVERGVAEAALDAVDREVDAEVEEVAEWALQQPPVEGTPEGEAADLFAPPADRPAPPAPPSNGQGGVEEKRFIDAFSDGLRNAFDADDATLLMGQDVAGYGGVFKTTVGFLDRYGPERVRNTPIIESGALGCALGLALDGFRPVVEMQYADFVTCGFNQIVNNLATTHYRWGAPVPVTVRLPFGGGIGAGPFHSQSPEAWFCHVPGLKVVVPATPADAKGLIRAAIADPNPVLVFEHKRLYRALRGDVPTGDYATPIGEARLARAGRDLTVVTWGVGVQWALDLAETHEADLEVIDLRTLVPWDREAVLASVEKTGRLLVLHEATRTGGFGAEVAAEVAEAAFSYLDAPPVRVGAADLPVPFSKALESDVYSARARLGGAVDRALAF
ncbi:dehydrogenase E1 component subunit alpha/beta [Rubrivirga sp. S365]|uniref:alpha-ketoacid dehydrogenase subunit alpha/beta n=1 Tax=Rubrivirga sp. S365 TaxID=3076080 RepID=UPI0028C663BF|nr:dehydrogenase E1 component subunit alpha/beta [Rubrivirga sp. S365]MDT7857087.1 dehydrogenase E1 component subunit alpha/beta [Rubrivirga sp. S365]